MVNTSGSFAFLPTDATVSFELPGLVGWVLSVFITWKALLTLFVVAVIYDQCMYSSGKIYIS
jgi:sterol 22-desaturase